LGKSGIELKKLTKEEFEAQKEAARQEKTAYFKREDVQKEKKIKKAIFINLIILLLSFVDLFAMIAGVFPAQIGIILLIVCCISSTVVSKKTTKKIR